LFALLARRTLKLFVFSFPGFQTIVEVSTNDVEMAEERAYEEQEMVSIL
jgi:hypothetical protein